MTLVSHDRTLADLVAENLSAAAILDRHHLDYCCHGDRTLADACAQAGVDSAVVIRELGAATPTADAECAGLSPGMLADFIVATHHRYLRDELPSLEALAEKVRGVHGERHPELDEVVGLVTELSADLLPHMDREEQVLFPAIHALEAGGRDFPFGSIANPIRVMATQHDAVGELLGRLRAVTGDYEAPADGCDSYRSLYRRLQRVELDTHVHVHRENYDLFPAALEIADRAPGSETDVEVALP
ncbi:MAG TPA: iron-sulfur cluster repair di-iron protein [Acidimicrobiia bacterium]